MSTASLALLSQHYLLGLLDSEAVYSLHPPFKFHFLVGSIREVLLQSSTTLPQEQRVSLLPIWGMVFSLSLPA